MEAIKSVMQRRRAGRDGGGRRGRDCADGIIKNLTEEETERGGGENTTTSKQIDLVRRQRVYLSLKFMNPISGKVTVSRPGDKCSE